MSAPLVPKTVVLVLLSACLLSCAPDRSDDDAIRAEVTQMAQDFLALREMQGFPHELPLDEAYRWQDEFVSVLSASLGDIAGYKTGGHDPGPGFPTFPPAGIRATILSGMILPSGTAVERADSVWGFLEADFALRVGSASINEAQSDLEILAGLDAVVPFAEIPDPYYEQGTRTVNGTVVANMSSRFAFAGEPVPIEATSECLQRLNTFTFSVSDEHGNVIGSGTMDGYYEPITVVRWLRDQLQESGKRLEPGQILSLGNIGIIRQIHAGTPRGGPPYASDEFRLEYDGLCAEETASVTIRLGG